MLRLVSQRESVLQESQLPLYLRPYEVLVTSNRTALIEMVPDTLSLHQLKAKSPVGTSLADHFFAKFIKASRFCEPTQYVFHGSPFDALLRGDCILLPVGTSSINAIFFIYYLDK